MASFDYSSIEEMEVLDKYRIKEGMRKGRTGFDRVRIIPSGIARAAAVSLFRDLIMLEMKRDRSPVLFKRNNSNPQPNDVEKRAIVLNDSKACYRAQNEGVPPVEREPPEEIAPPPPPPPPK